MAQIGGVNVLVIREEVTENSETTDKPVEQGADITDHTITNPLRIDLTCQLTDKNSKSQLDQLKKIRDKRTLITYRGKSSYSGLIITNIQSIGTVSNAYGFTLDISLIKPRIAKLSTYKVKAQNPATKKQDAKTSTKVKTQTNIGQQPMTDVEKNRRNELHEKRMNAYNEYRKRQLPTTNRMLLDRADKLKSLQNKQVDRTKATGWRG